MAVYVLLRVCRLDFPLKDFPAIYLETQCVLWSWPLPVFGPRAAPLALAPNITSSPASLHPSPPPVVTARPRTSSGCAGSDRSDVLLQQAEAGTAKPIHAL